MCNKYFFFSNSRLTLYDCTEVVSAVITLDTYMRLKSPGILTDILRSFAQSDKKNYRICNTVVCIPFRFYSYVLCI
jgi:hypothetical protein